MRILLDENLPDALVHALQLEGHEVDSVNSLRLKGIANSKLYREVAQAYDICFTKDAGFAHNIRQQGGSSNTKLLLVSLPQAPANEFVAAFVERFRATDWPRYQTGDDWP